jgi:hypothetical protein
VRGLPAGTLCALAALTLASAVRADPSTGVRIDALQAASPESEFFRVEGPHKPAESVEFAVRARVDEGTNELHQIAVDTAGNDTRTSTLVKNALLLRVDASITPVHWLTIEMGAPFALSITGDAPASFGGEVPLAAKGPGVGDPRAGVHVRPIDRDDLTLWLGGRVWAPVGSKATYLSDGRLRAEIDAALAGESKRVMWGGTVNLAPTFFAGRDGDRVAASGALYYKLTPLVALGVEPAFELVQDQVGDAPATSTHLQAIFEPIGAARLKLGFLRVGVAAGPGFGGAGAAALRVLGDVAVVFEGRRPPPAAVKRPDRDLDGVPDDEDACPDAAGPRSKDPAKNGCPQLDRDADGVPDEEDACPDKAGVRSSDPKANGCPDSDNDGLPDPIDACPNEPGKGDGCPRYARLQQDGFKINPPIDFGFSDRLSEKNRAALEEIAATAHANPKTIDQVSIGIGTKGARQQLSDKRAQAILLIMRAQALSSERYEVTLRDDLAAGKVVIKVVNVDAAGTGAPPPKK